MEKHEVRQFQEKYEQAAMWVAINKPLIAQMMYSAPNLVTDEVNQAYTELRTRKFNDEWMSQFTPSQQAGALAKVIFHEILEHQSRRGNRDPELWNMACDIKANNLLLESKFELPPGVTANYNGERFVGKSEEFIYDYLEEEKNNGKDPVPDGYEPSFGEGEPNPDDVAMARGQLKSALEIHGMGNLPQELQEAINALLNPKEQWYDWLRKYFTNKQFSGHDWTQFDRREYVRSGVIAPPFQSDSLGNVVISIDQSGSISQELLDYFAGHVNSILMDCKPTKVYVQYFDTVVHATEEFTPQDLPITLRRVCGGGTAFDDCCKKAEDHDAVVHLVLTDMYGSFGDGSSVPTVWATISDVTEAPFGDVVKIERGE